MMPNEVASPNVGLCIALAPARRGLFEWLGTRAASAPAAACTM